MTHCSSSPEAISGVLLAGDAVLNLSQQTLNCVADTPFVHLDGQSLRIDRQPTSVTWRSDVKASSSVMTESAVNRILVVSDPECSEAEKALQSLHAAGIAHSHCTLVSDCAADAFMDEEDAEAVAERLRQLGYM